MLNHYLWGLQAPMVLTRKFEVQNHLLTAKQGKTYQAVNTSQPPLGFLNKSWMYLNHLGRFSLQLAV
jgi:hypothetical protein